MLWREAWTCSEVEEEAEETTKQSSHEFASLVLQSLELVFIASKPLVRKLPASFSELQEQSKFPCLSLLLSDHLLESGT